MIKTFFFLAFILGSVFNCAGQEIFFHYNSGETRIDSAVVLIDYPDGHRDSISVKSKELCLLAIDTLAHRNPEMVYLVAKGQQVILLSESSLVTLGLSKKSDFLRVYSDTLNVEFDIPPFKHQLSKELEAERMLSEFPDFHDIIIVLSDYRESFSIWRPDFNMDAHSEYYAERMEKEACKCFQSKAPSSDFNREIFLQCAEQGFASHMDGIVHSMDNYSSFENLNSKESYKNLTLKVFDDLYHLMLDTCMSKKN